jgi:hypothetical protein
MILDLTRICFRGTSKFSWDGTLRNVEFPAVAPELLARCAAHATPCMRARAAACMNRCSFSIIISVSNMTSSDIEFLRSKNKASTWPVVTSPRVAALKQHPFALQRIIILICFRSNQSLLMNFCARCRILSSTSALLPRCILLLKLYTFVTYFRVYTMATCA